MTFDMKKLFWAYTLVVTVLLAVVISGGLSQRNTIERLERNNRALSQDLEHYVTENGKQAASIEALELTTRQFRQMCADKDAEIKALGLKVKRLKSISQAVTETRVDTVTPFVTSGPRDTLPVLEPIGHLEWADAWVSVKAEVNGGLARVSVSSRDTLRQYVHRVPWKFLCFRFGTKGIRQEIVSSNPHTQIVYAEYIEFVK